MNELQHYGILGQKWGVRRFQNEDGSLTPTGKNRYHGETLKRSGSDAAFEARFIVRNKKLEGIDGTFSRRWGVGPYQNKDGTLTDAGKKRYKYDDSSNTMTKRGAKRYEKDKFKNLDKTFKEGVNVAYDRDGIAKIISDLSGNKIPFSDLVAYTSSPQYVRRRELGKLAVATSLTAFAGVGIALLKNS